VAPRRLAAAAALLAGAIAPALVQAQGLFEAHSAALGNGRMDISLRETERRPRSSVLTIEIRQIGSWWVLPSSSCAASGCSRGCAAPGTS